MLGYAPNTLHNYKQGIAKSCAYFIAKNGEKVMKVKTKRLKNIWYGMKLRCYNENWTLFSYYGGRGIKVCNEWLESFTAFKQWALNNGYENSLTLDRIDNDKNYEPSNCRWATQKEQSLNKRLYKNNSTGTRGVYRRGLKYRVEIKDNKRTIVIGTFENINDAIMARKRAELKYYGKEIS